MTPRSDTGPNDTRPNSTGRSTEPNSTGRSTEPNSTGRSTDPTRGAGPHRIGDTADPSPAESPPAVQLSVTPWPDSVLDRIGHDPRSAYVERYWLGVLGPSSIWLSRMLADRFDEEPDGFTLDLQDCALSLGLGPGVGRHAPVSRTITRLVQFNLAQRYGRHGLAVRRHLPPLSQHHLVRLPTRLQLAHQHGHEVARDSDAA